MSRPRIALAALAVALVVWLLSNVTIRTMPEDEIDRRSGPYLSADAELIGSDGRALLAALREFEFQERLDYRTYVGAQTLHDAEIYNYYYQTGDVTVADRVVLRADGRVGAAESWMWFEGVEPEEEARRSAELFEATVSETSRTLGAASREEYGSAEPPLVRSAGWQYRSGVSRCLLYKADYQVVVQVGPDTFCDR